MQMCLGLFYQKYIVIVLFVFMAFLQIAEDRRYIEDIVKSKTILIKRKTFGSICMRKALPERTV